MNKIKINNKSYEVADTLATKIEEMIKKEQKALEKRIIKQELEDLALELNEGVEIDWEDGEQHKRYMYYCFYSNEFGQDLSWNAKNEGVTYCLSKKFLKEALKRIGEDRLMKLFED
jgi:hypothetical protein